ncbi:MAG: hypothetical protein V1845_01880 [bacterium]
MEEQKSGQASGQPIQSILADLKIRTMSDDLKGAPNSPAPAAAQAQMSTAPKAPPPPNIPAQIVPKLAVPTPPPAQTAPQPPQRLAGETLVFAGQPSSTAIAPKPAPVVPAPFSRPQIQTPPTPPTSASAAPPTPPPAQFASQPTPPAKKPIFKLTIIFGVLILAVGLAAGAYFFWPGEEEKPICQEGQITAACQCGVDIKENGFCCQSNWIEKDCSVTKPPVALISTISQQLQLNIKDATANKVIADIKTNLEGSSEEKARLVVLKTGTSPTTYATLDETATLFGLKIDSAIKNNTSDFNLLAYINPAVASTSTSTIAVNSGIASSTPQTEKEIRLLLVLKQKDKEAATDDMIAWEQNMLDDLKPIILGSPGEPATADFQNVEYHNSLFRYKNLPTKMTTINYTFLDDLLIIGTSKNSIYYVYDTANPAGI